MTGEPNGGGPAPEGVAGQASVEAWLKAYHDHWDLARDDAETKARLETLASFCAFSERRPDELVRSLFRQTPEGPRIRLKRRREVMAMIQEFEREHGGRAAGNTVRSFLIHNGVALSATPLR